MSKKNELDSLKSKCRNYDNALRDMVILANFAKNTEGVEESEFCAVLKGIAAIGLLTNELEDKE